MKLIVIQILLLVASICKAQHYSDTIFLTSGSLNFRYQIESVDRYDIYFKTSTGTTGSVSREKVERYVWYADPNVQFPRLEDGTIGWFRIIEVPGKSKEEIYTNLRVWFSESFKNSSEVIKMDDKDLGIIIGNGNLVLNPGKNLFFEHRLGFTLKVEIKDSRFKATISNLGYYDTNIIGQLNPIEVIFKKDPPNKETKKRLKVKTKRKVSSIFSSIHNAALANGLSESDW